MNHSSGLALPPSVFAPVARCPSLVTHGIAAKKTPPDRRRHRMMTASLVGGVAVGRCIRSPRSGRLRVRESGRLKVRSVMVRVPHGAPANSQGSGIRSHVTVRHYSGSRTFQGSFPANYAIASLVKERRSSPADAQRTSNNVTVAAIASATDGRVAARNQHHECPRPARGARAETRRPSPERRSREVGRREPVGTEARRR